uniref:WAP domain-containing protein n=1 Tax=Noctiluca scintillans TaxID=2966 RepID=A0A7S1FCH2_NOCSC|mmetsp:Transcript_52551/g.139984  ORF Transcript_52551/g.139984 Transcript_52551/m.139984 type:complete len:160 (+) Transcript_52551:55-534(+)
MHNRFKAGLLLLACVSGKVEQSALCPPLLPGIVGTCVEECAPSEDSACGPDMVCCSNGCGHSCVPPLDPAAPKRSACPATCKLIVSLEEHIDMDVVLSNLPASAHVDQLKALRIMIMSYEDKVPDCCTAFRVAKSMDDVKSVEFEGFTESCCDDDVVTK